MGREFSRMREAVKNVEFGFLRLHSLSFSLIWLQRGGNDIGNVNIADLTKVRCYNMWDSTHILKCGQKKVDPVQILLKEAQTRIFIHQEFPHKK
jgi:hypothetical protein